MEIDSSSKLKYVDICQLPLHGNNTEHRRHRQSHGDDHIEPELGGNIEMCIYHIIVAIRSQLYQIRAEQRLLGHQYVSRLPSS
jgi:hypothetical protein